MSNIETPQVRLGRPEPTGEGSEKKNLSGRSRRQFGGAASKVGVSLAPFVVFVLVWGVVAEFAGISPVFLPPPIDVWDSMVKIATGDLLMDMAESFRRLMLGLLIALPTGVALGVLLGLRRGVAEFVGPLVNFMSALSGFAWIPLAIIWFGLGDGAIIFVVWNTIFFMVLLNTIAGIRSVPAVYIDALTTMGGSRLQLIRQILLPGALPNIVTGLRMGLSFGWRGLIGAEIIAGSTGLGFLVYSSSQYYRTSEVFAVLIMIGILWLAMDRLILSRVERWTTDRWGTTTDAAR